jgi:hypothetical protein
LEPGLHRTSGYGPAASAAPADVDGEEGGAVTRLAGGVAEAEQAVRTLVEEEVAAEAVAELVQYNTPKLW